MTFSFESGMDERYEKKRKDGRKRYGQIMEVALVLFAGKGYHATSIEDIIQEAGIARRTFYTHFNSKEDLLLKIITHQLRVLSEFIDFSLNRISGKADRDEIIKITIDSTKHISTLPEMKYFGRMMLGEIIGMRGVFWNPIEGFMEKMKGLTINAINRLHDSGVINKQNTDPLVAALCMIGGIKELIYTALVREEPMALETTIHTMVNFFLQGLFDA